MATFFTADHHIGHDNILKYEAENRRFKSIDKMNDFLIDRHNEIVRPDDLVYFIGDVCFKQALLSEYLPYMHGRKILICGNHDPFFKRMVSGTYGEIDMAQQRARDAGYERVVMEEIVEIEGVGYVKLNHFPYAPLAEGDEAYARYLNLRPNPQGEALLIHGHVHSQWRHKRQIGQPPMLNVGVDLWNMCPVSEDQIREVFLSK